MHINEDLDPITSILNQTFELTPFKSDHDAAFGKIANILNRYGLLAIANILHYVIVLRKEL